MYNIAPDISDLLLKMRIEFPSFQILYKHDSLLCKFLGILLKIITFGQYKDWDQMSLTIGYKIYLSDAFYYRTLEDPLAIYNSPTFYKILRHERIHFLQYKKLGIIYSFSYLFMFPFIITYRAICESEAYTQSILADGFLSKKNSGSIVLNKKAYMEFLEEQFCGVSYLFMFPFKKKLEKWFDEVAQIAQKPGAVEDINIVHEVRYL
jgi:hypothetical protein